jgi:hypothetical protein
MRHAPAEVVAMVRSAVAERCQDNAYANAFGKALLRAE